MVCCCFTFVFLSGEGENCKDEDGTRYCEVRFFAKTPYSLGEFDQATALGVGVVTLLLSIRDIIQDFKFSTHDEFEYWRTRCILSIECGDVELEVARWRCELDFIDLKAKW